MKKILIVIGCIVATANIAFAGNQELEKPVAKKVEPAKPLSATAINPPTRVDYVTTTVHPLADAHNNGSQGGFALIKVTRKQWQTLKKAGVRLQISGNVMDVEWPDELGPILMDKGYGEEVFLVHYTDGKTNHVIGVNQAEPEVFWAAIATWTPTVAK